jgi:ATP-binding cassette subfamily F protein uup
LRDFLFTRERALAPVKALSGGERNRLLLARLFTRPANVLVLDEPTNDLDLETLELLEAQLVDWPGTLLLVSHDRAFLDNVVTSTWAFEGEGRVEEYVGGYEDYARQRAASAAPAETPRAEAARASAAAPRARQSRRLSYNERRELDALPARIDALEAEHRALAARIGGGDFYKEPREAIEAALAREIDLQTEIAGAYERWAALEEKLALKS